MGRGGRFLNDMFNFFQRPFGLNVNDRSIEMVLLSGRENAPKLIAMGQTLLPSGIIENGKVLDKESLGKQITALVSKPQFGRIKKRSCIFSLPEEKIFSHFFKITNNLRKEEELRAVKREVAETFPFSPDELYLDYIVYPVKDYKGKENRQREQTPLEVNNSSEEHKENKSLTGQISNGVYPENEVFLVACPKNIVNDYIDVLKICLVKPIVLGIESESAIKALSKHRDETILIVDIGNLTTNLTFSDRGKIKLSVSIPVAGNRFTLAISKKLNVSLGEAENLKIKTGLNPEAKEGRVFLILQQELREIIEEIKSAEKYSSENITTEPFKIVLVGGSAQLPYLSEYLSENLEKEVEIGDPWEKININILKKKPYLKEAMNINPILFTNSIGLALRGLEKNQASTGINLIKNI